MKVYIIRFEELDCGENYSSGISYVFDTKEKARKMLQTIKEDEMIYYEDREDIEDILKESEDSIIFDFLDEYIKYEIVEMRVE